MWSLYILVRNKDETWLHQSVGPGNYWIVCDTVRNWRKASVVKMPRKGGLRPHTGGELQKLEHLKSFCNFSHKSESYRWSAAVWRPTFLDAGYVEAWSVRWMLVLWLRRPTHLVLNWLDWINVDRVRQPSWFLYGRRCLTPLVTEHGKSVVPPERRAT